MASSAVPTQATPSAPGTSRDIAPGSVLADRYRIDERVGEGSASEVYLAEQVFLRRKVAVKVVHADQPNLDELVKRFESEAMVAAGIENPNIAGALEFGKLADGSPFFAVEYVPGKTLRAELASGPLSVERSLHVAKQVASALADTHEVGIFHHDLKPENLMLLRRGDDPDFVKVLDYGLARATAATKPSSKQEFLLGTPGYMAPEQALGQPVDGRADLYSLGAVLFEMLAGVRLFESSAGILAKQLAGHVPTFAERAPGIQVPAELEKLVSRLLAPSVAERFASADDVLEALNAVISGARASAPPPAPARTTSEKPAARISSPPPMKSSSPPPAMLRRTQSGPPMAADRLPVLEPPPPAKVPERAHAAAVVEDDNIPTTVSLPRVPVLPPRAPLPAVSAATAPPPAKPGQRVSSPARVGASSPSAFTAARARTAQIVSQARGYAAPLSTQLKGKGKLVGGVVAAGVGLSLLAFVAFRSTRHETASDLRVGLNAASPSASSQPARAATRHEAALLHSTRALATATAAGASDEASVFLSLASDYVRNHREVEAVALVSRVLARQPELKDDPRIAGVLSKTVRADAPQAADDSLGLLTSAMGEKGAELMYALSLEPALRDPVRRRVDTWLASKDFDRISSAALYSAARLRSAKTCDQKHALLSLAADVGGQQTLELLHEFDARTICGASDLKNCYPCLAADSRLKDSIQRLEKRLSP